MLAQPLYTGPDGIKFLKAQVASYDAALSNSKALEAERDKLTTKYNSIDPENLRKLSVLLPDSVDNIRLILEIEKIASPYGMALKDIKYNPAEQDSATAAGQGKLAKAKPEDKKDYGAWDLEFSTSGTYANFVPFLKDLEHNLRVVDVSSVDFTSEAGGAALSLTSPDVYKYSLKIKTYWLKN